ncbi:MAG: glycosyltransferase [Solirubrobacteraceae bacterium]
MSPAEPPDPVAGRPRGQLANLRRRIYLTYRYHGLRSVLWRVVSFPLRFTPLSRRVRFGARPGSDIAAALAWYRAHGRAVSIVIPSYRDAERVTALVASLRATTDRRRVQVLICDDASGPEHVARLRAIEGVTVITGEVNAGFAANVNRGLSAAEPSQDVVILNSDTIARPGWLAALQYATSRSPGVGVVGARLLYEDQRIQFAGTVRNLGAPEWFDHRFRFSPADWGPANLPQPVLAVTGACMYLTRGVIAAVGRLDEAYPMGYEDVDYCLRAWEAGYRVMYWPDALLYHLESITRGTEVAERERASQRVFWARWGDFFDARRVRDDAGRLRIVYVTEDTGIGGGHRDIFEHLNRLHERGHHAELWTLGEVPDWFALRVPVRSFVDYPALVQALAPVTAIKVATWWNTAAAVWEASVTAGIPVYLVQDIETSYYPDDERRRHEVLASYRPEFRYMTISSWNRERLRELGLDATLIPPGIDLDTFAPRPDGSRRPDLVLALGRSNPLKNLELTLAAWRRLPAPRPELCLFGIEPELAREPGVSYVVAPSDQEVNQLFNQATVFVQTSIHEGFCLPPLEAMATGGAVVCTDAHGNRDFCVDGRNCLMPAASPEAVSAAIAQLLDDRPQRLALGAAGLATAADYAWPRRIDALESFFNEVAAPRRIEPSTEVVPDRRPAPAPGR